MTIQKIIEYRPSDSSGESSNEKFRITLNILEDSSNYLIHRDILRHQLSQKQGTVSTKTRSEVRGGGKKPWRQKGTGRARAGSNRSPLWKGGGVIFGPKPKTVTLKVNKKERNLALQTLFYNKRNNMIVVPNLELIEPKTKAFYKFCQNGNINLNEKLLVIVSEKILAIKLATQNLKNVELISASNLNTLSLLKAKKILLTTAALNDIKEIYCERETRH
jgi:large subunit ribosomal protein L4